ncbi:MAG: sulfotransferase [Gammaproteobacteria bacterium]|nr:sulfotransferase [Gammaproteobacteria bacterium]
MQSDPASAAHSAPRTDSAAERLDHARELIRSAKLGEAISLARDLLDSQLEDGERAEALYLLAVAQRFGNHPREALATLQTLHDENQGHARAWQERGHVCRAQGWHEEAIAAYGRAVERNPALVASWRALAELHEHTGDTDGVRRARERLEYLNRLPPQLMHVTDLIHENKLYKAERLCRTFLEDNRRHIEGMRLLADIGTRLKIYDDAEFLLESCVEFEPDHVQARIDYANLLIRKTKFEKANEQARHLVALQPDNRRFRTTLATTLVGLGRFDEGIALYRELLAADPGRSELHLLTGHAQKTVGAFDDAVESYREAYRRRSDFGDAFWSLANTKTYRFTDREISHIKRYEQARGTASEDRIHLCFAAGKALEDRADYDDSFRFYERGNSLKRIETGYKPETIEERAQAQMDTCTPELFDRRQGVGFDCRDPIFIVGLPRAGSTLLEQILASHSRVDGTMELHNILALAQRLRGRAAEKTSRYPEILHDLDDDYFRRFGEQYIADTRAYRGSAPLFIDKMPNNFVHIGLIRLILPNAKVIDARRNPMACCFSCYKQLFGEGQEFTYGLEEVGRYYRAYVRLMDHWDNVLPGFVLRVMHEDVVDGLETQVRRILEFCDLPFEENCIRFHETERNIRTPSSEQVRQPIYREGIDRWRRYEAHLEPLREALGPEILERHPPGRIA